MSTAVDTKRSVTASQVRVKTMIVAPVLPNVVTSAAVILAGFVDWLEARPEAPSPWVPAVAGLMWGLPSLAIMWRTMAEQLRRSRGPAAFVPFWPGHYPMCAFVFAGLAAAEMFLSVRLGQTGSLLPPSSTRPPFS